MNFRNNYKSMMILSAILGLVCVVAWAFIIYKSFSLRNSIIAISSQAESALVRDAKTLSLKSALRESRDSVALVQGRFVTKENIPSFIDLIESRADNTGVKVSLDSINLAESLHIHVTGTGSWRNVVNYVSVLESLPYAVTVDNLSFSKIEGSSGTWNLNLDLVILVASQ